jgi:hypothetical protein
MRWNCVGVVESHSEGQNYNEHNDEVPVTVRLCLDTSSEVNDNNLRLN